MFCKNCGNKILEDSKFCGKCGEKVVENTPVGVTSVMLPPISIGKIIFQWISVFLFMSSLSLLSSSDNQMEGTVAVVYDVYSIFAVIVFLVFLSDWGKYRKTQKRWFGWHWIVMLLITSFIGMGVIIFSQALVVARQKAIENPENKVNYVASIVSASKEKITLPKQVDENTTMTDITAEGTTIRYHYLLSNIDTSGFSDELLKDSLISDVCQSESIKNLFDQGINEEFFYRVKDSSQTFLVHFTKSDCQ